MDSAILKIKRAEKHLTELTNLFKRKKPFTYHVETNFKTSERSIFARRDEEITNEAAIILGDLIHNLRSALDHAYWYCTNKYAKSEGEKKAIQFPFTLSLQSLRESVLPGLPKRVSEEFALALESLKPYREEGNVLLYAIHDFDIVDKHKLLIPTGNFTKITSNIIQKQVPDFPNGLENVGFGNCTRDVTWNFKPLTWTQRRKLKIPPSNILVKELQVPVEIVLSDLDKLNPALEVVQNLVDLTKNAVEVLYGACNGSTKPL